MFFNRNFILLSHSVSINFFLRKTFLFLFQVFFTYQLDFFVFSALNLLSTFIWMLWMRVTLNKLKRMTVMGHARRDYQLHSLYKHIWNFLNFLKFSKKSIPRLNSKNTMLIKKCNGTSLGSSFEIVQMKLTRCWSHEYFE